MPVYHEENILPNKNYYAPKNRYQEVVCHLKFKYQKYPWFSDIRIETFFNRGVIVYVWCKYQIDDTNFIHHELGYDIEFKWDNKKYIDIQTAEKKFKERFKNENWFVSVISNKDIKKLIVTSLQYPNSNINIFPDKFKDYKIDYRYIDLEYDYDTWFKNKLSIEDAKKLFEKVYKDANWFISITIVNNKLVVTANQKPYINTKIIPSEFYEYKLEYIYESLDDEFE